MRNLGHNLTNLRSYGIIGAGTVQGQLDYTLCGLNSQFTFMWTSLRAVIKDSITKRSAEKATEDCPGYNKNGAAGTVNGNLVSHDQICADYAE